MKYHAVLSSLDLSWTVIIQMCYPGAHLIVISKFPHYRIMCNIEDAGWGIRDCLVWLGKDKFIILARKSFEGTAAENVLQYGCGALNIDGCKISSNGEGRWPANLIHDGSEEVLEIFPNSKSGKDIEEKGTGGIWHKSSGKPCGRQYGDNGSASRFFYCAKKERDLYEYLTKLLLTPNGKMLVTSQEIRSAALKIGWDQVDLFGKDKNGIQDFSR